MSKRRVPLGECDRLSPKCDDFVTKARRAELGGRELEVKLAVAADDLERLAGASVLLDRALGSTRRELVSTYFDTPDGRLCRRGVALRVRRIGRRRVQTLKGPSSGTGAAADRPELEVSIESDTPDLAAFRDPLAFELAGLVLPGELVPVFTTRIERTTLEVAWPSLEHREAIVAVALDRGRILADGKEETISEVELELARGAARALFALVEELRAIAPVSFETRDKATRGYALALDLAPPPRKASRLVLDPEGSIAAGFRRIGAAGLAHALANLAPAADGRDPEGVHQLRVALRRLRSAFSLFRPLLADGDRERFNGDMRWLLGELGPARDHDVLASELLAAIEPIGALAHERAILGELLREGRAALHERVRSALESRRAAELWLDLAAWFELDRFRENAPEPARFDEPLRPFAAERLQKRWRRVKKLGRNFDRLDAEDRHRLRIALKKLRYGAEFLGSLWPETQVKKLVVACADLQDRLGHLNDGTVATRLAREVLAAAGADPRVPSAGLALGAVIGWHARAERRVLRQAAAFLDELLAIEPFWRERA